MNDTQENTAEAMVQNQREHTLLIIDDEPLLIDMFHQSMTRREFRVLTASSGREALDMLNTISETERDSIDLILTDMTMPEMDGAEVARALHTHVPHIPVLIATGHDLDPAQMGLPPNVVEILRKPYRMKTLAEHLHQIIDQRDL